MQRSGRNVPPHHGAGDELPLKGYEDKVDPKYGPKKNIFVTRNVVVLYELSFLSVLCAFCLMGLGID